ncbi:MAG: protein phosphatase 2C domain-containing protein, partial [Chloroflexota bacterium]
GRVRDQNEDAVLVITATHEGDKAVPSLHLFVVADGMGGHRAGEVASSLAARVAAHEIVERVCLPSLMNNERDARNPGLTEVLIDAVQAANGAVARHVPGGGTTLICALVLDTQVYVAHVGDSRAYAITPDGIEQMTHDHSLVDRLIQRGSLTPEEAAEHPQRNVLYRAVGQATILDVDTHVRKFRRGEYLLLCSDGLGNAVSAADMVTLIRESSSVQDACEALVGAAYEAGGRDNITVILWRPSSD